MTKTLISLREVGDLYRAGLTAAEIADRAGVSETSIFNRLKTLGVTRRPAGQTEGSSRLPHSEIERTVGLYQRYGTNRAAEILGVHPCTVRWRVARAGEPRDQHRTTTPDVPEGMASLEQAAAELGTSARVLRGRCVRGEVPGARRETTWPNRWLVPASGTYPNTKETGR
jgi:hypothetical protein